MFPDEKSSTSDVLNEVAGNSVSPRAARDPVMPMDIVASTPNTTEAIPARFLTTEKRRPPSESQFAVSANAARRSSVLPKCAQRKNARETGPARRARIAPVRPRVALH